MSASQVLALVDSLLSGVPLSQTPTSTTNTTKTPLIDLSTLVAILSSSKLPTTFDDSPSHAQSTIPITSSQTFEASTDHKETKIEEISESSLPPATTTSRTNELMSQLINSFVNNRKFESHVETTTATTTNNEPIVEVVEPAVVVITTTTTTIASKPSDFQITPKGSILIYESSLWGKK